MMKRPTKTHVICYVLKQAARPMTRLELMRVVHLLQGRGTPFRPGSNTDYFKPNRRYDEWMGPHARGLIRIAGQQRRFLTYELTETGAQHAREYEEWRAPS